MNGLNIRTNARTRQIIRYRVTTTFRRQQIYNTQAQNMVEGTKPMGTSNNFDTSMKWCTVATLAFDDDSEMITK